MRRLFIIRKDLHLSPGKLAAMVSHASELWWINSVKEFMTPGSLIVNSDGSNGDYKLPIIIGRDIVDEYIYGSYIKTICEARNYWNLHDKVKEFTWKYDLIENKDYGWINDKCLTELTPENPDGTTTVGVWFAPMKDDIIQELSKEFKLYRD